MNGDHMDKLISDIQQYLREEDRKNEAQYVLRPHKPHMRSLMVSRSSLLIGLFTLVSACVIGSLTVAILLLGFLGGNPPDVPETIWLLSAAGCGIFFSITLVTVWKRLMLLSQIEENIRLILESKREANVLLEKLVKNII